MHHVQRVVGGPGECLDMYSTVRKETYTYVYVYVYINFVFNRFPFSDADLPFLALIY